MLFVTWPNFSVAEFYWIKIMFSVAVVNRQDLLPLFRVLPES